MQGALDSGMRVVKEINEAVASSSGAVARL
jgi:hypothetical protein